MCVPIATKVIFVNLSLIVIREYNLLCCPPQPIHIGRLVYMTSEESLLGLKL